MNSVTGSSWDGEDQNKGHLYCIIMVQHGHLLLNMSWTQKEMDNWITCSSAKKKLFGAVALEERDFLVDHSHP